MTSTATLSFTAYLGGASAAQAAALIAAVPPPLDILHALGVRVISDNTTVASPVVRTLVLGLNPSSNPTATCVLDSQDSGAGVKSVTVTGTGNTLVAPPVVSFAGGRPATPVQHTPFDGRARFHQTIHDPANPASVFTPDFDSQPSAVAYLKVVSASVASGGSGYSAQTFIKVEGGLKSSGSPTTLNATPPADQGVAAVLTPTIGGGVVTGVAITFAGKGLTAMPRITVVDPTGGGLGAVVAATLGLERVDVLRSGNGFSSAPTVVLTPLFQAIAPAGVSPFVAQATMLQNLMTTALEQNLMGPVTASPVVIA